MADKKLCFFSATFVTYVKKNQIKKAHNLQAQGRQERVFFSSV